MRHELLKELYDTYTQHFQGKEIVLGKGNIQARILLIGEAPGKEEVKQGTPFVGIAGKNLNEFLEILQVDRKDIYITNAIKYRLSMKNPDTGRTVNRPATREEIQENRNYLVKEVGLIEPEIVITLGNVPLRTLTGNSSISIGSLHGERTSLFLDSKEYLLFPLYHPASVIYNKSLKEVYLNDLKKLREIMNKNQLDDKV